MQSTGDYNQKRRPFQSAEAIRAAIPTARLLGMVFSGCGGSVGGWNRRYRESDGIAGKERIPGVCVSRVDRYKQLWKAVPLTTVLIARHFESGNALEIQCMVRCI